ncbi:MAG: hypothetical protein AVDCRST_MAG75-1370 [uncultured Propionibacteriaceae bacterium]|uniref:Uncharacterized protein n=1 Tax=uncultured Propionibacteriaceae bacterium TaxID=257457 RepID=A0A6J4NGZ3_9ACTN|nr:MAG: hypothetical protein AVDCRST_MAG75-1370 [uncultured Propionibacteriaceae bacterium]
MSRRKRRANRAVLGGLCLMAAALCASSMGFAQRATTAAAIAGFVLLMYGVHLGWSVFYDSESDGPPS